MPLMPLALITSMTYEGIGLTMIAGHIMTSIIHSPSRLAVHSLACRSTGLDSGLMVGSSLTIHSVWSPRRLVLYESRSSVPMEAL